MKVNGNIVLNSDGSGQLKNVFIEQVSSLPTGTQGRLVYLTSGTNAGHFYYDGSIWQKIQITGSNVGGGLDVAIAGNISGTATTISSGTLVLAGGANITLSQNGNNVTISAGTAAAQNVNVSAGTSSGPLGTIAFNNSNNVSFGLNGSTVTASASYPAQSVQPVAISGSNGSFAFSTLTMGDLNGLSFYTSNGSVVGSYTVPSVPSQTVQTQNVIDAQIGGNTAGATALISSGTMTIAGGNNITLSQNGNAVTISGANIPAQSVQPVAISGSNGSFAFSTLTMGDLNGLSFYTSNGSVVGSYTVPSVPSQTVQTQNLFDAQIGGNTSGTTSLISSGTLTLAGGANVTLSQNGNAITISAGSAAAQNVNVSAGTSSGPLGTIAFANSHNVSFGLNGSTVTASVAGGGGVALSAGTNSTSTGTVAFSNSNGMTFGMNTNGVVTASYTVPSVPTQTVQTQNVIDAQIGGNTAGITALMSSGTVTLAGGNNITLSQNGNAVTISGPNVPVQTVQPVAISGSNGSFAFSTLSMGELNGLSFYTSNGSVVGSYTVPSVPTQTNQTIGGYAVGNTTGQSSSATFDARSLSFDGANGVSVGFSNGSVVISGATGGAGGGGIDAQIGGNTSGTTGLVSSGTMTLAGGNNITLSQNGNAITISGVNTVAQTNQTIGIYGSSNTTGQSSSSTYDARSLSFAGYGLVSVGQSGGVIQISGPNTTSFSPLSVGLSTLGNTSGNTGLASNQLVFAGGNNITLSGSTNGGSMTLTISAGAGGTGGGIDAQIGGNTAGTTALISTGTITFAGGNNITLSQNGNAITIEGATAAGALVNFSAGSTSGNLGSVVFSNGNNVSFGLNGSTITGSVLPSSQLVGAGNVTLSTSGSTISISGNALNAQVGGNTSGTTGLISTGTMTLAGGNNITLSQNGNAVTISGPNTVAQTNQTLGIYGSSNTTGQSSSSTYDARSLSFVGYGIISVGQSGGSIQISAPGTTSYAPLNVGISTGGNTSGNTGLVSNQLVLVGGSNITLSGSTNGGSMSLTISGGAGGGGGGIDAQIGGNTSGTTALVSSGTMTLAGGSNITLSQNGNAVTIVGATVAGQPVNFSAGTVSANLGSVVFSNSNGVSFGLSGSTITASAAGGGGGGIDAQIAGNTSGTTGLVSTGTLTLAGGNNITLSQNGNAITVSAPASSSLVGVGNITVTTSGNTISISGGGGGGGFDAQIGGNTSGTTALINSGTMTLAGGNNITVSQSGNALTLSGLASSSLVGAGVITLTTSGSTVSISAPAITQLTGNNGISLSSSGSTISIQAISNQRSFFKALEMHNTTALQQGNGQIYIYPANNAQPFSASRADFLATVSATSLAASTEAETVSAYVGVYTLNGSTLSLASSGSQSYAWTNNSAGSLASISGLKRFSVPINVNHQGVNDLFVAVMSNTTFANTQGVTLSNVMAPVGPAAQLQGLIGQTANNSYQMVPGQGIFSTTSAGMPASIGLSQVSGAGSGTKANYFVPVNFANVTA